MNSNAIRRTMHFGAHDYESLESLFAKLDRNLRTISLRFGFGGERQRVWIILPIAQEMRFLLFDKQTAASDVTYQFAIVDNRMTWERRIDIVIVKSASPSASVTS